MVFDRYIADIRSQVVSDPLICITPEQRKTIYDLVSIEQGKSSWRWRGWIAVFSAQYVINIFENNLSPSNELPEADRELPKKSIECAIAILNGYTISDPALQDILSSASESFGLLINESFVDPITFPINAVWAGNAATIALSEVVGYDIFQRLPSSVVVGRNSDGKLQYELWRPMLEERFVMTTGGDASGAAAFAYACTSSSTACDISRLHAFWHWWIMEAIPLAFEAAIA